MNNRGFAITGIIYTLFILFLMILLTVITGLNSFQKLIINSTENFATTFEGREIELTELIKIKESGIAPYSGKYHFKITTTSGTTFNNCFSYLTKGTNFNDKVIFSPNECNNDISQLELTAIYSFEKER